MTDGDIGMIKNQICYLKDNSKIKDISTSKYIWRKTTNWFIKKFS
jgi:hypothetical protein